MSKRARRSNVVENGANGSVDEEAPSPQRQRVDEDDDTTEADCSQARDFDLHDEGEVGIIEKVTLTNFMCHSYLEVGLGSNVNFVIGRNGSGKSAIMTGVLVGLGAKAAVTSRGNSIKHFIKDGCSYALVSIKLKNKGSDAYKPDMCGESIIVERRISRDGANGYKLKSSDGKVFSTKKDELILILDRFNIQIDNPISVLNQDTSRSFLNSSDAKVKYQFFLRATQLEEMNQDYQGIINQRSVIETTLKRKAEVLPEMAGQVKVMEEKYQDQKQLRNLKDKVQQLKNEMVWALVKEKRKELDSEKAKLEKEKMRVPGHDEKIQECQDKIKNLDADWKKLNNEINLESESAQEIVTQQREAKQKYNEQRAIAKRKHDEYRKLGNSLRSNEQERTLLVERIAEIKESSLVSNLQAERLKREQDLAQATTEVTRYKAQLSNSLHHRDQIDMAMKSTKDKLGQNKMETNAARSHVDQLTRKIQHLKDSQENRLKLFGNWTPDLLNQVKRLAQQGKFHQPPVGPIGANIKLRDQRWALGVEACLKGTGKAYCCHDNHDAKLLREIMSKTCGRGKQPAIVVSRFKDEVYNTNQFKARSSHPTLLDMLDIQNPTVANCLIDQLQIESVLMIEEQATARNVMWKQKPANAAKAYALNGDEIIGGRSSKYYSNRFDRPQYLQANVAESIRQVEVELQHQKCRLNETMAEKERLEGELRMHQTELQRARQKCHHEQDKINRLQTEIQELSNFEEEQPPDVTTLEEEVETCNSKIADMRARHELAGVANEEAAGVLQQRTDEMQALKRQVQDFIEWHERMKNALNDVEEKLETAKSHRVYYEQKKDGVMKKIEDQRIKTDAMATDLEDLTAQASEFCEEIDTGRTPQNLESEIVQSEKRISREEKARGNPEEISSQYFNALQRYEEVTHQVANLKRFQKKLTRVLERRAARFADFRGLISVRAKSYFLMMLSQRGYTGRIKIDHKREELSVHVNVEQVNGTTAKDTRSLSGGERSFSTICFITALWEAMESPFRILDEFDVFMDMVNRRISMQSLLKIARLHNNRQFIFLTPQDMSHIDAGGNVRIFRLRDPERGQGVINFPSAE